jgi:hypothetical protein
MYPELVAHVRVDTGAPLTMAVESVCYIADHLKSAEDDEKVSADKEFTYKSKICSRSWKIGNLWRWSWIGCFCTFSHSAA